MRKNIRLKACMMREKLQIIWSIGFLILINFNNVPFQTGTTNDIIWSTTIHCHETEGNSDYVIFGEAPDANDGAPYDIYDVAKAPAPIPPYIRICFNDNLPAPYNFLWYDYRQYPDTEKIWNLTVLWIPESGTALASVSLNWDINDIDNSEYNSITLCNNTGFPLINMLLENTYIFDCPTYMPQYFTILCKIINQPPETPQKPSGETSGEPGKEYIYSTITHDPNNDELYYQWNWGDGSSTSWLGPFSSGKISQATHTWTKKGNYAIYVKAKDVYGEETNWSESLPITMPTYQNMKTYDINTLRYYFINFFKKINPIYNLFQS